MYKYTFKILIISNNDLLKTSLEKEKPLEGFEYEFERIELYDEMKVLSSNIIIVEDDEKILKKAFAVKPQFSAVVFCGENISSYEYTDDVWRKPISDEGLRFCFNHLMAWIKIDKERLLNKTYLETLINNSQDLIWFKDIKGSHDKVNDAFCRAVNKPKSVVEGRGHYFIWDITPDEYSKGEFVCLESEQDVMKEKRTMIFDEKVKTADGMRQLLTVKSPMFDEFGNIMGTVGCAKDVTDINNISREISIFFENIPFGVIISDADDIICEVNTNMEMMSGYKKDTILGTKVDMDYPKMKKEVTDSQDQNVDIVEFTVGGEQKILEMTKVEITDVFKKFIGIMRFFKDVTQERNLEIQVLHNANTDFLTGLYNRRYFYDYVKENCIGKPISLIFMDLDNFKRVNDTYGHQAGDDALVLTADILRKNCNDGLIVRNGGDEFIVVINNSADMDKLEERTKHLMSDFETAFKNDKRFVNVSASMGLSAVNKLGENGNNIDEIIKKSDAALYLAKNTKKGSYRIAEIN